MGSPYFATNGYASPLTPAIKGSHPDLPGQRATGLHQDNHAWRDYPPASPHRLPTTGSGPTLPPSPTPKGGKTGFGWSASPASTRTHHHGHGNINPSSIDYA